MPQILLPNSGENMLYLESILRTTFGHERVGGLWRQLPRRPRRRRRDSLATAARRCGRRCSRRPASPSRALYQRHSELRKRVAPPGVVSPHKGRSVRHHTPKTRSPLTTRTRAVLKISVFQSLLFALCSFSRLLKLAHQSGGGIGDCARASRNWSPPTCTGRSRASWRLWRRRSLGIPPASSRPPPPPQAYRGRRSKFQPLPCASLPMTAATTERCSEKEVTSKSKGIKRKDGSAVRCSG